MKHISRILCLLLALTLLPLCMAPEAQADTLYLIPDSNTRRLTEEELWQWDRESLSYIFNEIFARHGYVFKRGGKYDLWFRAMPWYQPNASADNQKYALPKVTKLEWENYDLIKKVAKDMDAAKVKTHDAKKKCYSQFTPPGDWTLTGFSYLKLKAGQKLAVYSAPGKKAWRGNGGKASVSTNGAVWAAGWDNGWLLIFYETNNGSIRVGYVEGSAIKGSTGEKAPLYFARQPARVIKACRLTDDPLKSNSRMADLSKGAQVTYLTTCVNGQGQLWDYVETEIGGQQARGFVPAGCLDYAADELPDIYYEDNG